GVVDEAIYDFEIESGLERYLNSVAVLRNCTILHSVFRREALKRFAFRQTISLDHVLISHLLWHGKLKYMEDQKYFRRYFENRKTTSSERISGHRQHLPRSQFYLYYLDDFASLYSGDARVKRYVE